MSTSDSISCEQALKLLLEFVDRELHDDERESMEQHLRACRSCFSRMEFESRLKQRLSTLATEDAPAKSRDRIRAMIKRF